MQNHHLIPSELRDHPFIARAGQLWDHDYGIQNGKLIWDNPTDALNNGTAYHSGYHPSVNSQTKKYLDNLEALAEQDARAGKPWSAQKVNTVLENLAQRLSRDIDKLPCGHAVR